MEMINIDTKAKEVLNLESNLFALQQAINKLHHILPK